MLSKGADYLLAVKGNQPRLEEAFNNYFRMEMFQHPDSDSYSTQESGHGRKEARLSLAVDDLSILGDLVFEWPELKTLGIVAAVREVGGEPAKDIKVRYYISSAKLSAKELLEASRSHWSIESQLHWQLDVGMREDDCQTGVLLTLSDSARAGRRKHGHHPAYCLQCVEGRHQLQGRDETQAKAGKPKQRLPVARLGRTGGA